MSSVEELTQLIEEFLSPLLHGPGNDDAFVSIIEKLSGAHSQVVGTEAIVLKACEYLKNLHEALIRDATHKSVDERTYDVSLITSVYGLLDLIMLEGIYPSLTPGVVSIIERRSQSILFNKTTLHSPFPKDPGILEEVLYGILHSIACDPRGGLQLLIRGRILNDLIAAYGDLAFSPKRTAAVRQEGMVKMSGFLDSLPISIAYQGLTSAMKPQTPDWFRIGLSEYLGTLPTKPTGVRQLIEFIASSHPSSSEPTDGLDATQYSSGPLLPMEAVAQASKVLSSVPKGMETVQYIAQIGPQLLELLDGTAGAEMQQVAGFVIARGILGKRSLGAPATPGWIFFVEPLQNAINPPAHHPGITKGETQPGAISQIIVDDDLLQVSLRRLLSIIKSHNNVALTGRLLRMLILPLWAIATQDRSPAIDSASSDLAFELLQAFFRLVGSLEQLQWIIKDFLTRGSQIWVLGPGSNGGIAVRRRESAEESDVGIIQGLSTINHRVELLSRLLSSSAVDSSTLGTIFVDLLGQWLRDKNNVDQQIVETTKSSGPFETMTAASIIQMLLRDCKEKIASEPRHVLQLIAEIFADFLNSQKARKSYRDKLSQPGYTALAHMANSETIEKLPRGVDASLISDDDDTLSIAVSVLISVITDKTFKSTDEAKVKSIRNDLRNLQVFITSGSSIQTSVVDALAALDAVITGEKRNKDVQTSESAAEIFRMHLELIQKDLGSASPPIRTSALQSLNKLISDRSSRIDIAAVTVLLLHTIQADADEYVYLAAIRTLVDLAFAKNLKFVMRFTLDAFQDPKEEAMLDGRLRLGEVLVRIVQDLSNPELMGQMDVASVGNVIRETVEVTTQVAGRRGQRQRELKERKQRRNGVESEKSLDNEHPRISQTLQQSTTLQSSSTEVSSEAQRRNAQELEVMEAIVGGWEDTGSEEDVRIRTSALSILSQLLEFRAASMSPNSITEAIDLALSVLVMETNASKSILRRAAVLVILGMLRAMDQALEERRELPTGLDARKWSNSEKVLRYVMDTDNDEIVRGHASAVLESLEAWRMESLFPTSAKPPHTEIPQYVGGLEGRLRGLNVFANSTERRTAAIQEIEE